MSHDAAYAADVQTIDSIIHAMYDVISGPAGRAIGAASATCMSPLRA